MGLDKIGGIMFDFLKKWDPILCVREADIEHAIRRKSDTWLQSMQIYYEWLLKLFNEKEQIISGEERLCLKAMSGNSVFMDEFIKKTGYYDVDKFNRINQKGNDIKHVGKIYQFDEEDIINHIKSLHSLSLKTYNYLMGEETEEIFDKEYFVDLMRDEMLTKDEIIQYADLMLARRKADIENLSLELKKVNRKLEHVRKRRDEAQENIKPAKDRYRKAEVQFRKENNILKVENERLTKENFKLRDENKKLKSEAEFFDRKTRTLSSETAEIIRLNAQLEEDNAKYKRTIELAKVKRISEFEEEIIELNDELMEVKSASNDANKKLETIRSELIRAKEESNYIRGKWYRIIAFMYHRGHIDGIEHYFSESPPPLRDIFRDIDESRDELVVVIRLLYRNGHLRDLEKICNKNYDFEQFNERDYYYNKKIVCHIVEEEKCHSGDCYVDRSYDRGYREDWYYDEGYLENEPYEDKAYYKYEDEHCDIIEDYPENELDDEYYESVYYFDSCEEEKMKCEHVKHAIQRKYTRVP